MCQGASSGPAPRQRDHLSGAGGQAAAAGDPAAEPPGPARRRRRRPVFALPFLGRAPGPAPDFALVLRHPPAHRTKTSEHPPEQPKGNGLIPEGGFPRERGGSAAAGPGSRLCRRGATPDLSGAHSTAPGATPEHPPQHHNTQHGITAPSTAPDTAQLRASLPLPPSLPAAETPGRTTLINNSWTSRCIQK